MQNNNKFGKFLAASSCCAIVVLTSATIMADEELSTSITHFVDTATDRIPAMTTFPKYPSVARRDRIQGEATVCFKIRSNGKISRAVVTERSHRIFSRPSLRAMRKSTYEPIGPAQILAVERTCRTYRFRLEPILVSND